jgi:hypothetical protein
MLANDSAANSQTSGPAKESVDMIGFERRADKLGVTLTDQRIWLSTTLLVATIMVALIAYVLSFALFGPSDDAPPHRSADAMMRTHSDGGSR